MPAAIVIPQQDGSVYVPLRLAELVPAPREELAETIYAVVPVLAEELEVQTRVVETGKVRITKVVHEREAHVDEPLWREEVEVTRVPMQRVVDGPVPVREETWHDNSLHGGRGASGGETVDAAGGDPHPHTTQRDTPATADHAASAKTSRWSVSLTPMTIHEGDLI